MPKKVKQRFWSLISYQANVTEARKNGIVSELYSEKDSDTPILFDKETGQQSENAAISYIKSHKLEKQLKQIPLYPEEMETLEVKKTPVKVPVKKAEKKTSVKKATKPKVVVKPKSEVKIAPKK